ncbi:universal stress protein [uncultured Maribacter sp.]|uniref:universal stress protein n=1 Tax=uncultured Maribacter sp. TaxID=431308 RepID=UPI0030DDB879|tara:strand:- start:3345 stop:4217 length:873 start_codon:yes stop_codon:yes gene_type:complete
MKNILVPTDFSPSAYNAVKFALHLFNSSPCVFYFLNTYTPELHSNRLMAGSVSGFSQNSMAALSSEKGLKEIVRRVKKDFKNPLHSYKTISSFSLLTDEVKETIIEHDIDFVIMGAIGSSDNETIYLGRNTVRILNAVNNCPVFAIPYNFEFTKPLNIAFVSDSNHFFNSDELDPILTLAKIFNSSVCIVTLQQEKGQLLELQKLNHELFERKLENVTHTFHQLSIDTSLAIALDYFFKKAKCQLLVMSNSANSFMKNLCSNFVVERSKLSLDVPIVQIQGAENSVPISK